MGLFDRPRLPEPPEYHYRRPVRQIEETCPCGSRFTAVEPDQGDRNQLYLWRDAHRVCRRSKRDG